MSNSPPWIFHLTADLKARRKLRSCVITFPGHLRRVVVGDPIRIVSPSWVKEALKVLQPALPVILPFPKVRVSWVLAIGLATACPPLLNPVTFHVLPVRVAVGSGVASRARSPSARCMSRRSPWRFHLLADCKALRNSRSWAITPSAHIMFVFANCPILILKPLRL